MLGNASLASIDIYSSMVWFSGDWQALGQKCCGTIPYLASEREKHQLFSYLSIHTIKALKSEKLFVYGWYYVCMA